MKYSALLKKIIFLKNVGRKENGQNPAIIIWVARERDQIHMSAQVFIKTANVFSI